MYGIQPVLLLSQESPSTFSQNAPIVNSYVVSFWNQVVVKGLLKITVATPLFIIDDVSVKFEKRVVKVEPPMFCIDLDNKEKKK